MREELERLKWRQQFCVDKPSVDEVLNALESVVTQAETQLEDYVHKDEFHDVEGERDDLQDEVAALKERVAELEETSK